ncbi:MAG: hypothetical protein H8E30_01445, partial [Alphaproteobacteria bacterium]|nr:hypothetical protein [Alphaproteobacteria bacterium]
QAAAPPSEEKPEPAPAQRPALNLPKQPVVTKGFQGSAPVHAAAADADADKPPTPPADQTAKLPPDKAASRKTEVLLDALQAGKGSWDDSVLYLQTLLSRNPDDKAVRDNLYYVQGMRRGHLQAKNMGDQYYKRGVRKWLKEDYIGSAKAFAQAVRQNPDDLPAVGTYGFTLGLAMESPRCNMGAGCRYVDYPKRIKHNQEEMANLELFRKRAMQNPWDLHATATHNYIEGLETYNVFLESTDEKAKKGTGKPPDKKSLDLMSSGITKLLNREYGPAARDFSEAYQLNVGDEGILFALQYIRGRDMMRRKQSDDDVLLFEAPDDPRMTEIQKELSDSVHAIMHGAKPKRDPTIDIDAVSLQNMIKDSNDLNPFVGALSEAEVARLARDPFFIGP